MAHFTKKRPAAAFDGAVYSWRHRCHEEKIDVESLGSPGREEREVPGIETTGGDFTIPHYGDPVSPSVVSPAAEGGQETAARV